MHSQSERYQGVFGHPPTLFVSVRGGGEIHEASGRGESHPPALAEPGVSVSAHRAPTVQPSGRTPTRQWAKRAGSRRATLASHFTAWVRWPRNRLYFRMAQRTRYSLMRLRTRNNLDL